MVLRVLGQEGAKLLENPPVLLGATRDRLAR